MVCTVCTVHTYDTCGMYGVYGLYGVYGVQCVQHILPRFARYDELSQALVTLGKRPEMEDLLRTCGVNPRGLPKLLLDTQEPRGPRKKDLYVLLSCQACVAFACKISVVSADAVIDRREVHETFVAFPGVPATVPVVEV